MVLKQLNEMLFMDWTLNLSGLRKWPSKISLTFAPLSRLKLWSLSE